ncbi:MAG: 4Fe-4S dicluster domain-containing protein [Candidatus Omnitrophota bacterium]
MCEFCTKHGEGKDWYLNVKNYSLDLLNDPKRKKYVKNFFHGFAEGYRRYSIYKTAMKIPLIGTLLKMRCRNAAMREHWGQVIPIEDVEKVLSIATSVVRVPCVCHKIASGKEKRVCFLVSLDDRLFDTEGMIDRSYFGPPDLAKFEKFDKRSAVDFMRNEELHGAIHTIWTEMTPFIGAICNCTDTGCIAINTYKEMFPPFFHGEFVASIMENDCAGCGECVKICPFGALKLGDTTKKAEVAHNKCYGCGICRRVCKKNAISLERRALVPA